MKKILSFSIAALTILTSVTAFAETDIKLYINEEELICEPSAVISNNRLLVPFRAIFEKLGANVNWDDEKQTVMAIKDSSVMFLQVNTPTLFINSEQIDLDAAPVIIDDHAMVPVRAVTEAFDIPVDWNNESRTVSIKF